MGFFNKKSKKEDKKMVRAQQTDNDEDFEDEEDDDFDEDDEDERPKKSNNKQVTTKPLREFKREQTQEIPEQEAVRFEDLSYNAKLNFIFYKLNIIEKNLK